MIKPRGGTIASYSWYLSEVQFCIARSFNLGKFNAIGPNLRSTCSSRENAETFFTVYPDPKQVIPDLGKSFGSDWI